MKKYLILQMVLSVLLVSVLLVGCKANAKSTAVAAETIAEGPATVEAYGTVQVRDKKNVTVEIPGKITAVHVISGQQVHKGDVLFEMNIQEYLNDLTRKRLEVTLKEQELKLMNNPADDIATSLEQSAVEQIEAKKLELSNLYAKYNQLEKALKDGSDEDVKSAKLNEAFAEKQYLDAQNILTNSQSLFDGGIISKSELDAATTQFESTQLTYETSALTSEKILKNLNAEKSSMLEQIKNLESQINQLNGVNEQAVLEYDLKKIEIEALTQEIQGLLVKLDNGFMNEKGEVLCEMDEGIFDGFNYVEGDIISGNSGTPTFTLYDANSLEVYAKVSEDFIGQITLGQKVNIIPVADREHVLTGEVTDIAELAYQEGGEAVIPVRIKFEDETKTLKINYSVDVAFILE